MDLAKPLSQINSMFDLINQPLSQALIGKFILAKRADPEIPIERFHRPVKTNPVVKLGSLKSSKLTAREREVVLRAPCQISFFKRYRM